jgi:hypothetical protein
MVMFDSSPDATPDLLSGALGVGTIVSDWDKRQKMS